MVLSTRGRFSDSIDSYDHAAELGLEGTAQLEGATVLAAAGFMDLAVEDLAAGVEVEAGGRSARLALARSRWLRRC